ncbi:uncharacterized protein LOC130737846 [Lotus japonicus]|uniref:Ribosomal protein S24e family protein n=1 Tax=Lotus japonicus TaxID=34305 RepID=I3SLH0_LOTJA|nr:uncharacterized protein LOC130737846 [Lotus japonicus]XP_057445685.1 uncharacterized protein LOC130737846 [Lotus japonicus]AFK41112.1 unknown [Lotus japonicus]AFK47895.1 unknown [Lotus japonicus]
MMGSVFRATIQRTKCSVSALQRTHGLQAFGPRCFSTEAEQPPQPQDSTTPTPPFFETDNSGLTYARLHGIHRNMLKTDVISFLEGCNLTLEDVKVEYNRNFFPLAMLLQFPTRSDYSNAIKVNLKNGRFYKFEMVDRGHWDIVTPYDGKAIVIQGIPMNAAFEDIERTLSGCDYDASSVSIRPRDVLSKLATVRFPSRTKAMSAFITKNRTFCLNNRVSVEVLQ